MQSVTSSPPAVADPYRSRISDQWEAADRHDPVFYGEQGPLTAAQREEYETAGFLSLDALLPADEAAELLREARRLAEQLDPQQTPAVIEPGNRAVRSIFRIHHDNPLFRAICQHPRIVDLARQILGSDVYIHQSRINFKPPLDGKEFFWHSDFETWHVEDGMPRMRAVSISMNLTENHEFNGPLMLIHGSHHAYIRCAGTTPENHFQDSLRKQEYGVPNREAIQWLVERGAGIEAPKGSPGSAVVFDCNTMHGSVGNLSPHARTNLFVVYNSVENALVEPYGGRPPRPGFLGERQVVPIRRT